MADWVPIDDPNDPRLANTPLNEPAASAPQAPTIDFQPAAPASTGPEIQFHPATDQAPPQGPRGGDYRDLVTQSLLDHGVKPVAAAAILGDIQQESEFNPHGVGDHGSSFGLLQVGGPMFRQFQQDQERQGISPGDPQYVYNQAPFVINKFAQQHPDRFEAMQNAPDAPTALKIFRSTPDWGYGIAGKRYQYAQNYQQALSGVPVQQVDTYTRVEKAVPVNEVEHQVARALPVNGARPPLPATDTLNAPPAPADQIAFTPATAAQQPQDGINFTPAQDVLAQGGETRVNQIAADLLQDPNAPVAQTAPTDTGELPPQPAVQDWTTGAGHTQLPFGFVATDDGQMMNVRTGVKVPLQGEARSDYAPLPIQVGARKAAETGLSYMPPILAARKLLPESSLVRQAAEGTIQIGGGLAESLTEPLNAALAAATFGGAEIEPVVLKTMSNVFAAQMASQFPELWQAYNDAPDFKTKFIIAGQGLANLIIAAGAAKHGVFGEETGPAIPGAAGATREAAAPTAAPEGPPATVPVEAGVSPAPATGQFGFESITVPGAEPAQPAPVEAAVPAAAPEAAPANLPDWMNNQIDALSAPLEANGVANQIEDLAAQRLTAKQIANKLGLPVESVIAVRTKRGIPSMNMAGPGGAGGGPQLSPEFQAWVAAREANAPAPMPIAPTAALETAANDQPGATASNVVDTAVKTMPEPQGDTVPADAGATQSIPLDQMATRPELMQYKRMDDQATGTTEQDRLTGEYDPHKAGIMLLWEPNNPKEYGLKGNQKYIVANGHYRYDFFSRQGVPATDVKILRESDGYSAGDARAKAAEVNIADGKGTIFDQANFIREQAAAHGQDAALGRARQIGARGQKAATIALQSGPDLYTSFINEKITPDAAATIAETAPGNEPLQRLGLQYALQGENPQDIANYLQSKQARAGTATPTAKQVDLFGTDDTAAQEDIANGKRAGAIQKELSDQINTVAGAARRPEKAAALGVNVKDPKAVAAKLQGLRVLRERARRWAFDPQIRDVVYRDDLSPEQAVNAMQAAPAFRMARDEPGTLYHGTTFGAQISKEGFRPEKAKSDSLYGPGFYFTDNPHVASGYATEGFMAGMPVKRIGGSVVAAKLDVKTPFRTAHTYSYSDAAEIARKAGRPDVADQIISEGNYVQSQRAKGDTSNWATGKTGEELYKRLTTGDPEVRLSASKLNAALQKMGFDGITYDGGKIIGDRHGPHNVTVAFKPDQIKFRYGGGAARFARDEPQPLRLGQAPNSNNLNPDPHRASLKQIADNDPGVIEATKRVLDSNPQAGRLRDALLDGGRVIKRGRRIYIRDKNGKILGQVDNATGGLSGFEDVPTNRFEPAETAERGMPQNEEKVEQYAGLTTKPPLISAHGPRFADDTYQIINGHHRWKAAQIRGDQTIRTDYSIVDPTGRWLSIPRAGQEAGIPDYAARLSNTIDAMRTGSPTRFARDEPGFALAHPESVEEQKTRMATEKAKAEQRSIAADKAAQLKYGWKQRLTGTAGDLGQGSLIGHPEDLFAPVAKPRGEGEPPTPIPAAPPRQTDFKFQKGAGSVAPGSTRRYTLPDEIRQRFQPRETTSPQFAVIRTLLEARAGGPVDEVHLLPVRDVGTAPRSSGERSIDQAEALANIYAEHLSWFRGRDGLRVPARGLTHGENVFLNADMLDGPTGRPVHLIAAHELAHVMESLHPDLYYDLVKHADTTRGGAYIEALEKRGYRPDEIQHEMVADLVADTLADPTRMRQAMGETPGLFPRLASYIRDFIDHTLRKLGLRKDDATASGLVDNLKAARADVMKALEQVRTRRAAGQPAQPQYHYSLDEPPSQADLEDAANDKEKMRGHIATIKRMTEVSPDVKAQVESWYEPTTLDAVNNAANETINKLGLGKATDAFMGSTKTDAGVMALGHNLALRLDEQQHYEDAAMVRDKMAEKLTTPAQSLWYISTIGKTSPEGLIRTAQDLVTQMIKPEDKPLLDQINRLRAEISKLKDKAAKDAATRIVIKQLAQVNKPGQRLTAGQLDNLLQKHSEGNLNENQLASTLTRYFNIPRLTPENIAKIKAAQKAWADVPDSNPILKQVRAADMMDTVYGLVPRSFWDKVRAASVISMIMHGKLPLRIGASSALRLAGQTVVDGIQNFLPDMGNIFSGRATRTGGQVRGIIEGMADPLRAYQAGYTDAKIRGLATVPSFKEGMHALLTRAQLINRGFTDATMVKGGMFTFSSRFGRLMENTTGLLHNVMPLAFYDAAYRSSLYRQMRAARVGVPDADMVFNAHLDANKVISNNPTLLYKFASEIRKGLDLPTAKVMKGKYGLGTALLPFALKPASLLSEGLTWTPLGLGKATAELLRPVFNKGEPLRPKEIGDALIKAALGTGVLVGAGYQLAKIGVLTGAPDANKDLEAMRKASGWGAYKINVSELKRRAMSWDWHTRSQTPADGDYIVNYNWLEPAAFPVAAGADLAQSETKRMVDLKRGKILPAAALSAAGAGLQSLVDSPMLQGVQQFSQAVGEGQWGRAVVGLFANVPGNFVPALVRQTSQYMDNTVRETRGTFSGPISGGITVDREASNILAQIPGLEQRYPAKYDVFGNAIERYNYGNNSLFNVFFNPAMVSKFQTNPQLAEMQRLYEATGATKGELRQVPATLTVNGKQVELTNEQVATYQRYVGKEASAVVTRLLASPQFAAEPMGTKQAVIANVLGAVNNAAKMDLFGQSPVTVGMGMKGPTVSQPSVMDIAALIAGRKQGLKQSVMTPGPVAPQLPPLWRLAPPPALPSRAP